MSDISFLIETLNKIFRKDELRWSNLQLDSYVIIKEYCDNDYKKYLLNRVIKDKSIILSNIKLEKWYAQCPVKSFLSTNLSQYSIEDYNIEKNSSVQTFDLVLKFSRYYLHCNFYKNITHDLSNFFIFFENNNNRAYLANNVDKKLIVPEFSKIYKIVETDHYLLPQLYLLCFYLDLLNYYDSFSFIKNTPFGRNELTFSSLIDKISKSI
jgi:hypothetical protein